MHCEPSKITQVLNVQNQDRYRLHIETAARSLRNGEIVAFPTETVYGLGIHKDNAGAVERLYEAKRRPEEKKLTLMISDIGEVQQYVDAISDTARKLMDFFWPGPLAIIFPLKDETDICIRFPDNTIARDLIRTANIPIATTSANISGHPPATDAAQVAVYFEGKIDIILDGGPARSHVPSTIVKIKNEIFEIVRLGIIPEAAIQNCLKNRQKIWKFF
ncbi:MAG: threonylcarbamoyl-AMP synthase [Planctomycetes bacterium]|nr:threonylcarbamoyl-AMP synthase [Planctomycetota bacterium]